MIESVVAALIIGGFITVLNYWMFSGKEKKYKLKLQQSEEVQFLLSAIRNLNHWFHSREGRETLRNIRWVLQDMVENIRRAKLQTEEPQTEDVEVQLPKPRDYDEEVSS